LGTRDKEIPMRLTPSNHADRWADLITQWDIDLEIPFGFLGHCGVSTYEKINEMKAAAKKSSFEDMAERCDLELINKIFPMPINKDAHVSFHKSVYDGVSCYYFVHSGYEWIWVARTHLQERRT
jgi:hypothetical protein